MALPQKSMFMYEIHFCFICICVTGQRTEAISFFMAYAYKFKEKLCYVGEQSLNRLFQVAIKTIKKAKIESEGDLIRIRREIQIMSSLRHPYIIHIYEGITLFCNFIINYSDSGRNSQKFLT